MIRKIVMASAIAALPVAGLSVVSLSGVASAAKAPAPPSATCVIGGTVTFPGAGISAFGDTSKKGSSTVALTDSSGDGCTGTSDNLTLKTKSSKCKAPVTTGSISLTVSGTPITVNPASNIYPTLPQCEPAPKKPGGPPVASKNDEANSAWGFAGGVLVNGVASSTASQLPTELKKGVPVTDAGNSYTLLVQSATAITPGGVCGSNDVGFALSGNVKKYTSTTWSANVCLGNDSATGTTSGTFLGDLTSLIEGTGTLGAAGSAPISGSAPNTYITSATIDTALSTLTIG